MINYNTYIIVWLGVSHTYGYGSNGCQDIDDLLSDVYRLGDTQRLWPEEDEEFQQYCLNSIENSDKVITYFDTVYPHNLHIQIIVRLMGSERTRLLMNQCKNRTQRAKAIKVFKGMNTVVEPMERVKNEYVNKLLSASEPESKAGFKELLVWTDQYEKESIKLQPNKMTQAVLAEILAVHKRLVNFYLANVRITKRERPDTNPCPREWRPFSIPYAQTAAFNRVFSATKHH
ncbi:unnamed protein product [Medioppia subpectinata]|uniref:Uncharacterized protein n=1 Tax=Medioppia subpectinata TaxID=1979941 RepID=A0A7R9KNX3_9ACAR|nr:unnamed protein product [Medioppia subpectinata]CAG2106710.1 unnamed protein product [Medioppia subpectinata]